MDINALKNMLDQGQDNLLLRFGLGQAMLREGQAEQAIEHLLAALEFDARYSAAWKLLGKAYGENGQQAQAMEAFQQGIEVAEAKGDIQAAKEMKVFLKRLQR
jgi:predicted Zn-dependent protease